MVDQPYLVPTHLREPQSIGAIPVRTFYTTLAVGMLLCAPFGTLGRREFGDAGLWIALVPLVLAIPFALPWLDPPAEHGARCLLSFLAPRRTRTGGGLLNAGEGYSMRCCILSRSLSGARRLRVCPCSSASRAMGAVRRQT